MAVVNKKKANQALDDLESAIAELAAERFVVPDSQQTAEPVFEITISQVDIDRAIKKAARFNPLLGALLDADS